jgi:hypothetical protein
VAKPEDIQLLPEPPLDGQETEPIVDWGLEPTLEGPEIDPTVDLGEEPPLDPEETCSDVNYTNIQPIG